MIGEFQICIQFILRDLQILKTFVKYKLDIPLYTSLYGAKSRLSSYKSLLRRFILANIP